MLVSEKVSLETVGLQGAVFLTDTTMAPVLAEMSSPGLQWVLGMRRKWGPYPCWDKSERGRRDPELREWASLTERRLLGGPCHLALLLRPEARWAGTPIKTREPKQEFKGAPGKQTAEQSVAR